MRWFLGLTVLVFFFNDTATTEIYTLSLHDALPISGPDRARLPRRVRGRAPAGADLPRRRRPGARHRAGRCRRRPRARSEEHTSELQSRQYLVCRLLLEKKKKKRLEHHDTSLSVQDA